MAGPAAYGPALELASRAVDADGRGLPEAAELYEQTAGLFDAILAREPDEKRRAYVAQKRDIYVARAAELRALGTPKPPLPTLNGSTGKAAPREAKGPPPGLRPPDPAQDDLDALTGQIEGMLGRLKVTTDPAEKKVLSRRVSELLDRAESLKQGEVPPSPGSANSDRARSPISPRPSSKAANLDVPQSPRGTSSPGLVGRSTTAPNAARQQSRSPQPFSRSLTSPPPAPRPSPSRSPQPPAGQGLTREEKDILRASSRINGLLVLPWSADDPSRLPAPSTTPRFLDPDGLLPLAPKQKEKLGAWKRPDEWMPKPRVVGDLDEDTAGMIRQESVMDCSVVAGIVTAAAWERRQRRRLITSLVHPGTYSQHGLYLVRLHLNGISRSLLIDDLLPFTSSGQPLFTYAPGVLWVSLLEKAWMKANGGYDYPGGGASVDVYGLTGWIPEEVYLHVDDIDVDALWRRMLSGHATGRALVTAATAACDAATGLVPNHAYAVLDVREEAGERLLLVKNPWRRKRWRGRFSHLDVDSWTPELRRKLNYEPGASREDDGTFWIDFASLVASFDSVHVNWDPEMFPNRHTVHVKWEAGDGPKRDVYSLGGNPQFSISTGGEGEVWLLLSKHVVEKEENLDYITLHLYDSTDGQRIYYPSNAMIQGVYINSPHVLIRFTAPDTPHSYTLVVSQHEIRRSLSFTVRAFSYPPLLFAEIPKGYPHEHRSNGSWTAESAGGCMSYASFYTNPQYRVSIPGGPDKQVQLFAMLEAPRTFAVNIKLVRGSRRVSSVAADGVVASSGDYRHGFVYAREQVPAGDYVVVVSTYEPGLLGDFFLTVGCTSEFMMGQIPKEGNGLKETRIEGEWIEGKTAVGCVHFRMFASNPSYLFVLDRRTRVRLRLQAVGMDPLPALNVAIFRSSGEDPIGDEVAGSGAYSNWLQGVSTPTVSLDAGSYVGVVSTWEPRAGKFLLIFYCEDSEVVPIARG
ncbi:hypothetical protein DFJ74DRAFT_653378 [Hyaloraphidium curvatum]|nr:hypothetical protein DFJ74DRAFT_653378 [Hyaloraphidium curvatum]